MQHVKPETTTPIRALDASRLGRNLGALAALSAESALLIGRYDHVTRLPNRLQFLEDFARITAAERRTRVLILVTLADATHFNAMLRALGHAFSEDFVRAGAQQVEALLPTDTTIYHVSVLSLAFMLDWPEAPFTPQVVESLSRMFDGPVVVNHIPIKAKVGIGLIDLAGFEGEPPEVLRSALAAAQDSRGVEAGWAFYNRQSDNAHLRAFRILNDLPAAISSPNQLGLVYQPRVALESGRLTGAEALLRWHHPELGPISPGEFIPLAEQTSLIGPLTEWVFATAIAQVASWRQTDLDLTVSINASPTNLAERGFDERLLSLIHSHGLEPDAIEIEFTEGSFIANAERTTAQLSKLRAAGTRIAIDDFGAGYSSLQYLAELPADILKIDQSFIRPLGTPKGSAFLVRQIVDTARGLGFKVCAEGIETQTAYDTLAGFGCEEGQGFLLARPMAPSQLPGWAAAR